MSYIELKDVSYFYPHEEKIVLSEINLKIKKDGITALIGSNGSGKTTLTKVIMGIIKPCNGEIFLDGQAVTDYTLAQVGQHIGYVFQNPEVQLFCSSVGEEVGFSLRNRGYQPELVKEKVDFYLDYFDLKKYRNTFPLHLSQGEKQRIAIAAVLANDSDFLILDEPTTGLDGLRKKKLEEYLKKAALLGKGVLLVSHDENFVGDLAQRIVTMEKGKITSDVILKGVLGNEA
ncbi:energy-coupling factor ABC transporter ATP-binding protein [Anaerovorax odorimutans]|uniref:energy-coupling factor ABC transporter ATP-binding protein n=1 Tax=Anaerovorax odorimutans TaxID=109327 RepID=UPI000409E3CF|nr:ABC transporter ATP-binding protein [Anaerovorax odorimutans]